jgi:hypothetical protein
MKHALLGSLAGLALMACTPADQPADTASNEAASPSMTTPADPAPPASPADPADACNMAQYMALVGKPATDPGVPAASASVRHIRPDTQVTMDFRPDRLNIDISAEGVITAVRCG